MAPGPARAAAVELDVQAAEAIAIVGQRHLSHRVRGDIELQVLAGQREVRRDRKGNVRAEAGSEQLELRERPLAACRGVGPLDLGVRDSQYVDTEIDGRPTAGRRPGLAGRRRRGAGAARSVRSGPGRRALGGRPAAEVLPIVAPLRVALEIQHEARELGLADLDVLREQRQQTKIERGAADLGERLVAEALRVAERSVTHRDAQRRENVQAEVTVEHELAARGLGDRRLDLPLVVVRVHEHGNGDHGNHDDQHDGADDDGEEPD